MSDFLADIIMLILKYEKSKYLNGNALLRYNNIEVHKVYVSCMLYNVFRQCHTYKVSIFILTKHKVFHQDLMPLGFDGCLIFHFNSSGLY